ncbi:GET complex subunit GET2 KNAG_0B02980 [Huiozyma naganishii CBS 8797]|uniref:Golgi to ER traffic protein 2 n=1 Tax=Huiozyma naganishii (strain ATCC MYA-139 / BCRC 22969 / CBS 8797 / KCTC 17520 / NBRC 10181 / NCYC 3082 / Yp74L-3) TaxID=1071383 RepID=J7R1P5_HUIN7|nr:hypothetical protein KNAG_0B02980 [Kazachstania naganishii CBS 8797]CCK68740.1 hypothetical protein KNAG_0B02980 [Kazachstania naganishii CBS 8797]
MSELSDAEKRRLLKERRQKKFANGGASSRLNKITGQADSHLSTTSPLENEKKVTPTTNLGGATAFSEDAGKKQFSSPTVTSDTTTEEKDRNIEVELLKQLAGAQKQDGSSPDLFSLLKSMNPGGDTPDLSGMLPEEAVSPVDQALLNYHDYLVNRLKAWSILIKWCCFLLPYMYLVTRDGRPSVFQVPKSLSILTDPSHFFMVFTSFEIVAVSIFYQRLQTIERTNKVNTLHNTSKIVKLSSLIPEGVLPISNIKGKIVQVLQYWDVLSIFLTDVCFVLVFLGIMMYI